MRLPKFKGFTTQRADAFWLTCEAYSEQELFFGWNSWESTDAWVKEHKAWKEIEAFLNARYREDRDDEDLAADLLGEEGVRSDGG